MEMRLTKKEEETKRISRSFYGLGPEGKYEVEVWYKEDYIGPIKSSTILREISLNVITKEIQKTGLVKNFYNAHVSSDKTILVNMCSNGKGLNKLPKDLVDMLLASDSGLTYEVKDFLEDCINRLNNEEATPFESPYV